ncbi:MAG TPA: HDIG domain-containing protein [Roseiflexaceae bacterium]|nr:HDIG domain-containing protein [Roseiflexaceae bacterium]
MQDTYPSDTDIQGFASLLGGGDTNALREELMALFQRPAAAGALRALDQAGLLTRVIPELEPARSTTQPNVHFLPVLAHSLEAVCVVDWLLAELEYDEGPMTRDEAAAIAEENRQPGFSPQPSVRGPQLPVAVQTHPELRYRSAYADQLRRQFAERIGGYSRAALFKLAALMHDVGKPATKQPKPGGGVSFHEHQTIGGEVALEVARRLRLDQDAAQYIRLVVREHMRPGQFAALNEVTPRAVARYFHATAGAGPDVLLHMLADHMATRGPRIDVVGWQAHAAWVDVLLDTIWGELPEITPPLLNGDELMRALDLAPGPLVGRLLAAVSEAQAGGDITTPEEAIALARRTLERLKVGSLEG